MYDSTAIFDNVIEFPLRARPCRMRAQDAALARLRAAASLVDAAGRTLAGIIPPERLEQLVTLSIELSLQELWLRKLQRESE